MEKRSISRNARVTNTDEQTRATACVVACAPPPASFFLEAQARKLSLSASLAWAEGALKCHPRNNDGGAAIYRSLERYPLCFGSIPRFSCCLCDTTGSKTAIAAAMILFEAPPPEYACTMVCRRGCDWCPGRQSLRFTIYRINRGRRQISNSRRIAPGALAQCEDTT